MLTALAVPFFDSMTLAQRAEYEASYRHAYEWAARAAGVGAMTWDEAEAFAGWYASLVWDDETAGFAIYAQAFEAWTA